MSSSSYSRAMTSSVAPNSSLRQRINIRGGARGTNSKDGELHPPSYRHHSSPTTVKRSPYSYRIVSAYSSYNVWFLIAFTLVFVGVFLLAFLLPQHVNDHGKRGVPDDHTEHYTPRFFYERDYPSYHISERSASPEYEWHTILNDIQTRALDSPGYRFYSSCASNKFSKQLAKQKARLRSSFDIKDRVTPVFFVMPGSDGVHRHGGDEGMKPLPLLVPSLPILQYCEEFTSMWPSLPAEIPVACVDKLISLVEVGYPSLSAHKQSNIHLQVKFLLGEVLSIFHLYQQHIPLWDFGSFVEPVRVGDSVYRVVTTAAPKIETLTSDPAYNMAWYYVKILHNELVTNRRFIHQPLANSQLKLYFSKGASAFPPPSWELRPVWNCLDLASVYVPFAQQEEEEEEVGEIDINHFIDYIFFVIK